MTNQRDRTQAWKLRGKVALKLAENIDTDIIFPGRYLNIPDRDQTAEHVFELAYPDARAKLGGGGFIVAGKNFGCGSSREQATAAIKYAGAGAVIAVSVARIFYRNSINLGLPVLVTPEAPGKINEGDELELDLSGGEIHNLTTGAVLKTAPLDPQAVELLAAGGLVPYLKRKFAA